MVPRKVLTTYYLHVRWLDSFGMLWGVLWVIPKHHCPFFDLCRNWIPAYTGKDRTVVSIGAALLRLLWKARKKSCFQSILPKDPTDVIFTICYLLDSWAILQKRGVLNMLREVPKSMTRVARDVYRGAHGWGPTVKRIC